MRFENLLYGWSDWGLEGSSRFQVIAATPGFSQEVTDRAALWQAAQRLCFYNPDALQPDAVSMGWAPTRNGVFIFRRESAGPDRFGRLGTFTAQVLYGEGDVTLDAILTVVLGNHWLDQTALDPGQTVLNHVDPQDLVKPPLGPHDFLSDELLVALLKSITDQRRVVIARPWQEVLDAFALVVDRLPIDSLLSRSFSSFEAGDAISQFGIVGVGEHGGSAEDSAHVVPQGGLDEANQDLANLFFTSGPEKVEAAIEVATPDNQEFSPRTFVGLLTVLGGDASDLTPRHAAGLIESVKALELVFRDDQLGETVVRIVLENWQALGVALCSKVDRLSETARQAAIASLAQLTINRLQRGEEVPQVTIPLRGLVSSPLYDFCGYLLNVCAEDPALAERLPVEMAVDLIRQHGSRLMAEGQLRQVLVNRISERSASLAVDAGVATEMRVWLALHVFDEADDALTRKIATSADGPLLHGLAAALASRSHLEAEVKRYVRTVDHGGDDRDIAVSILRYWRTAPPTQPFAWVALAIELELIDPVQAVVELGRVLRAPDSLTGRKPDVPRGVASRAESVLSELVINRSKTMSRPLLTGKERKVVQQLARLSSSLRAWGDITFITGSAAVPATPLSEIERLASGVNDRQSRLALSLLAVDAYLLKFETTREDMAESAQFIERVASNGWAWLLTVAYGRLRTLRPDPKIANAAALVVDAVRKAAKTGEFGRRQLRWKTSLTDEMKHDVKGLEGIAKENLEH